VWLKLLGLGLSVILMFVGELWPSGTLKALYRDAKMEKSRLQEAHIVGTIL